MKIVKLGADHRIGGSMIEIASKSTRVIFDVGKELEEERENIDVPGLYSGPSIYQAVFISHYHEDHMGRIREVNEDIPIYMEESSYKIAKLSAYFRGDELRREMRFYKDKETIMIGDIAITPYWCEHSAFSSFMFLVEVEGKKILYTGDYRGNGVSSYKRVLASLPQVDILLSEGTCLSEPHEGLSEYELREKIREAGENYDNLFLLSSSTNLTRTISFYKSRGDREFIVDPLGAPLLKEIGQYPRGTKVYNPYYYSKDYDERATHLIKEYGLNPIPAEKLLDKKIAMTVRPSSAHYLFESLCEKRGYSLKKSLLIYSLWRGYEEKSEQMKEFIEKFIEQGGEVAYIHSSGHASEKEIEELVDSVSPSVIIPVHSENPEWFLRYKDKKVVIEEKEYEEI